jgi:hypothetical protein
LSKDGPSCLFNTSAASANDPGRITVLIYDLFYFFRINTMPSDMFDIVLVPFRL